MISVAYDETSCFETTSGENEAALLGGLVYHSPSSEDTENEKKRIVEYYKAVCAEIGTEFPRDLHPSAGNGNRIQQRKTRERLKDTLGEFLSSGTLSGKPLLSGNDNERKGSYQIICLMKNSSERLRGYGRTDDVSIRNDLAASNLYINMAEKMILKMAYTNPLADEDNRAVLYVPTRMYPVYKSCPAELKEPVKPMVPIAPTPISAPTPPGPGAPKKEIEKFQKKQREFPQRMKEYNEKMQRFENDKKSYDDRIKEYEQQTRQYKDRKKEIENYNRNRVKLQKEYNTFRKLGYRIDPDTIDASSGKCYVKLIDASGTRTVLKYCDSVRNLNAEAYTESIRYSDEKTAKEQAFMYLCDTLCMALRTTSGDVDSKAECIEESYAKIIRGKISKTLRSNDNMFFYYDPVDDYYDEASKAVLARDFFKAFSCIYEGERTKGNAKEYYRKKWFPMIEKEIEKSCSESDIIALIAKLKGYRFEDGAKPGILFYVFSKLEALAAKNNISNKDWYDIYDLGISAYTHTGNAGRAEKYYLKCQELADYVDESDLFFTDSRIMSAYNDMLRPKSAIAIGERILSIDESKFPENHRPVVSKGLKKYLAKLINREQEIDISKTLSEQVTEKASRPRIYKILGALGQSYAFSNFPRAEECFLRVASDRREEDRKDSNYWISLSYLLHWYIEKDDRKNYERYATEYFDNVTSQAVILDNLLKDPEGNKYKLFVFCKAFYRFYRTDSSNADVRHRLANVINIVGEHKYGGHPWEIIFKYSALLALEDPDEEFREKMSVTNMKASKSLMTYAETGPIIRRILDYGSIEYYEKKLETDPSSSYSAKQYRHKVNELWDELADEKSICVEKEDMSHISIADKRKVLADIFTYMYH